MAGVSPGVALPPSIPALDFDVVRNRLLNELNQPQNDPYIWTTTGPLKNIVNIGDFYTDRFSHFPNNVYKKANGLVKLPVGAVEFPGAGGKVSLRTPKEVANSMHKYVANALPQKANWKVGHKKLAANLIKYISTVCQNKNAAKCTTYNIGADAAGIPTYGYFRRDINPGCAASLAALFDIFYGGSGYPQAYSAHWSRRVAREASRHLTKRRGKIAHPGFPGKWVFPSASCPCIKGALNCNGTKFCKFVAAVPGKSAASCILLKTAGISANGFPSVDFFAGQRYFEAIPEVRRAKTVYARQAAGAKTIMWRKPQVGFLPNVDF